MTSSAAPLPHVLFDLDGTLTDPYEGITRCLQHALSELGHDIRTQIELRSCIGPPLRQTFASLLATDDSELIERAVAHYRERFFSVGLFENELYAGTIEMLEALQRNGHRMFIVTSKVASAASRIIEYFGIAQFFERVYGSDLDGRFDDKGELIAHVLIENGLHPSHCVMVGDRLHDIQAARRNEMSSIGATWGFAVDDELSVAGATCLCSDPTRLP
ncbi:MAG: HAD-IA family hydrolase, partial [bacterium]|nr:HAD-IA family hydrolase [Candidatus Kapabacteria bacterium]